MRTTFRSLAVAALLVLPAATGAAGCAGPGAVPGRECTLLGCDDGVTARIGADVLAGAEGTVTVRTCADGDCREQEFPPGTAREGLPTIAHMEDAEPGDDVGVAVEVVDDTGAVLAEHTERVTLERVQPNGPDCPPVCAVATVEVAG